jgi:hypothetical protein
VATYEVTEPMSPIPCVAEVNESPDFAPATYAGEQGEIGTYFRLDADDHNSFLRSSRWRSIVIGAQRPLAADKDHWLRLSCGGDVQVRRVRTLPALSGAMSVPMAAEGASAVTWGYTYNRSTDTISGGGTASCSGGVCPFAVDRGKVYYFRRDSGQVNLGGPH